jgi:AcrR family transcriptional regulator
MVKEALLSSKERRDQEKVAMRERILDAAREMFAENGVEATTMRAIAERIGYTATAIYYHFKDKDALLLELCHCDFRSLGHEIARAANIPDPIERLRATGRAYVDFGLQNPSHYQFMFMTHSHPVDPGCVDYRGNPEEDAYAFLMQTVQAGFEAGRFREDLKDAGQIAIMCWAAAHGVISLYLTKMHDEWVDFGDVRQNAYLMIDATLAGLVRT